MLFPAKTTVRSSGWFATKLFSKGFRFSVPVLPMTIWVGLPVWCLTLVVSAQNLVWTGNGTVALPGNGTWNLSDSNRVWNDGTGAAGNVPWSVTSGDMSAVFGGVDGSYPIALGAGVSATNMLFLNSGYSFSADSAQSVTLTSSLGFTVPQVRVSPGKTVVIGGNVALQSGQSLLVGAYGGNTGGTLILTNGGSVQEISSGRNLAVDGAGTIVRVQSGGAFKITSTGTGAETLSIGITAGSSSLLSVEGGTVSTAGAAAVLNVGNAGVGTLTISNGTVSVASGTAGVVLGAATTGGGTINLNGGTLVTPKLSKGQGGNAVLNFNGGMLVASADNPVFLTGLTAANVRNIGADVNDGGYTITIGQPLLHSPMGGDNPVDGGLIKSGAGTLYLNGLNTYNGSTIVNAGSLGGTGVISGSVLIGTSAALTPGQGGVGTLTIGGNLNLLGDLIYDIDKSTATSNACCIVNGVLNNGGNGTLTINNQGPPLAAGDVFVLFNKPVAIGGSIAIISSEPGVIWTNKLAVNGTVEVLPAAPSPPVFFTAITSTASSLFTGESVTFSGSASGSPPIRYQWQCNGVDIPGANDPALTLTDLAAGNSGNYSLVASNAYGSVTNLFPSSLTVMNLDLDCVPVTSGIKVSWDTSTAYQYQMLITTNLAVAPAAWSLSGSAMIGTGERSSVVLPITNSLIFVRVRATPVSALNGATLPAQGWENTQWHDPAGWTTVNVNNYGLPANSPAVNASVAVSNLLNATKNLGRRRLYFPAGTYYFSTSLAIATGDLWVDGDGRSSTLFSLTAPAKANATVGFYGTISGDNIPVTNELEAGDIALTVRDAGSLKAGDFIQLYAATAPLANGGAAWSGVPLTNGLAGTATTSFQCYSQIFQILARNGNTLTLDMKVLLDYPLSYTPMVRQFYMLQNLKLSNFKFQRTDQPTDQAVANLQFYQVYNCEVENFESSFSQREHLFFANCKRVVLESNYVHDCWVHNTGGYGYGYGLCSCTGCRVSNNRAGNLRHEIIMQSGSAYNVLSYNSIESPYDYDDLSVCHAGYTYMNLMEGNSFYESTSDGAHEGDPSIDGRGGPGNTWFRNQSIALSGYPSRLGPRDQYSLYDNMIGNVTPAIVYPGVLSYDTTGTEFAGANRINGIITWGQLPVNSSVPASLYLTNRPVFFPVTSPWPLYGPGLTDWGVTNQVPAKTTIPTGA